MNKSELHESIQKNSQVSFARSGGSGGQNVNKVNTKVYLTLPVSVVGGITEEEETTEKVPVNRIYKHHQKM